MSLCQSSSLAVWLNVKSIAVCCLTDRDGQRQGLALRLWPFSCHLCYTSSYGCDSCVTAWPPLWHHTCLVVSVCFSGFSWKEKCSMAVKMWVTVTSVEVAWQGLQSSSALVSYVDTVCYEWLPAIIKPSVWPQWHSLARSTRCALGLIHLCKPAITGIIALPACTAHHGFFYPELCVRCSRPCACLFCSCGWRCVMNVPIYCSLQISQPFIHPKYSANEPHPPEQLSCSTPIDKHCHIPDSVPPPIIPCFMAPKLHSSSWGDWTQLSCAVTAQWLLIHAHWHLIILGVWYGFWNW